MDLKHKKKIEELQKIVKDLDWDVVIPVNYDDNNVPGLIIGETEFVKLVVKVLQAHQEFERDIDQEDGTTFH